MKLSPKHPKRYKEIAKIFWKLGQVHSAALRDGRLAVVKVQPEALFKAYLQQVLLDGLFHAVPHPGNVFLTDDGHIALLDLDMVGHSTPTMQGNLIKLLLAISEGKGDEAADIVICVSQKDEDDGFKKVEIKAVDAKLVMAGFQKVTNRFTTGIVFGALILGACLLMRVESSFRLHGYPGLAIVCFRLAATGAFCLDITIFVNDHRTWIKPR